MDGPKRSANLNSKANCYVNALASVADARKSAKFVLINKKKTRVRLSRNHLILIALRTTGGRQLPVTTTMMTMMMQRKSSSDFAFNCPERANNNALEIMVKFRCIASEMYIIICLRK